MNSCPVRLITSPRTSSWRGDNRRDDNTRYLQPAPRRLARARCASQTLLTHRRVALKMKLSFVVPAHNEEHELPGTLSAIHAAAAGHDYEIIVVDDASTDATAVIAA